MVRTTHCQSIDETGSMETDYSGHRAKSSSPTVHAIKRRPGCLDPRFKRSVTTVKSQMASTGSSEQYDNLKELSRSVLSVQSQSLLRKIEKTTPERDTDTCCTAQQNTEKSNKGEKKVDRENVHLPRNIDSNENEKQHFEVEEYAKKGESLVTQKKESFETHREAEKELTNANDVIATALIEKKDERSMKHEEHKIAENTKEREMVINEKAAITEHCTICNHSVCERKIGNDGDSQSNGQVFVVVEQKAQALPVNSIQIESIPISQLTTQCYNVHVPLLTYQNVPLQISTCGQQEQVNVLENTTPSNLHAATQYKLQSHGISIIAEPETEKCYVESPVNQCTKVASLEGKSTNCIKGEQGALLTAEVAAERDAANHSNRNTNRITIVNKNYDTNVGNVNWKTKTMEKLKNTTSSFYKYEIESSNSELYLSNEADGSLKLKDMGCQLQKRCQRKKMKSEQNLLHLENLRVKRLSQSSDPHISSRRKRTGRNLSKKAKSYFQKNSQVGIADSDCTLIWPGCRYTKRKSDSKFQEILRHSKEEKHCQYPKVKESGNNVIANNRNGTSTDCSTEGEHSVISRSINSEGSINQPVNIPLETQQLLNKSYLEYYNKLKQQTDDTRNVQQQYFQQIALGAPEIKKRRGNYYLNDTNCNEQAQLKPEIQILEQCSALSSIINKTLDSTLQHSSDTSQTKQIYLNRNIKSSTDPTGGTQSGIIRKIAAKMPKDIYEDSIVSSTFVSKVKHKREKRAEKRFLRLQTILFFGSMMYALVVFLPMIYDYFFYEEYEEYDDLSYLELVIEYAMSSFKEAFGSFFSALNKIFFQPRTCRKCNNGP